MFQENVNIKSYNTFGINVNAKLLAAFNSEKELIDLLESLKNEKLLILGGGSNILFKGDFDGTILLNRIKGIEILEENDEEVVVKVGAGEVWHDFVLHTIEKGWGGIENLSLIPGKVGASPMQNIGAYGVEIKDTFVSLNAVEIATGNIRTFNKEECQFGYRESVFKRKLKNQYVITSVSYRLSKCPVVNTKYGAIEAELEKRNIQNPTIKDVSDAVIAIRESKLPNPKVIGNGGSFFKNPIIDIEHFNRIKKVHPNIPSYPVDETKIKVPAGWLIDQAGWKGKRFGDCGVHKDQALVLVNYGNATGTEIYELSENIIKDIHQRFDIQLEREVNLI